MFVLSKRNIIIPAAAGEKPAYLHKDELANVPDWVADTTYFKALIADGKVVVTGKTDKELQAADEAKTTTRRGAKASKE